MTATRPVKEHTPATANRRELNKIGKLLRIKDAARQLFVSFGFDDTTTREIAIRADVALGTIFTYADNKRDLLFLIANDDLEEAVAKAERVVSISASWIDNCLAVFKIHYEIFLRNPSLSRLVLRELWFYDSGEQAQRAFKIRMRLLNIIFRVIDISRERGEVRITNDRETVGWLIFGIYQAEVRSCLISDRVTVKQGMRKLRKSFEILDAGLRRV